MKYEPIIGAPVKPLARTKAERVVDFGRAFGERVVRFSTAAGIAAFGVMAIGHLV